MESDTVSRTESGLQSQTMGEDETRLRHHLIRDEYRLVDLRLALQSVLSALKVCNIWEGSNSLAECFLGFQNVDLFSVRLATQKFCVCSTPVSQHLQQMPFLCEHVSSVSPCPVSAMCLLTLSQVDMRSLFVSATAARHGQTRNITIPNTRPLPRKTIWGGREDTGDASRHMHRGPT